MRISPVRVALFVLLFTTAVILGTHRPYAQGPGAVPDAWLSPPSVEQPLRCATGDDRSQSLNIRPRAFVPDGRVGSWVQEPAILTADYDGAVVLRDFMVFGDVPTARFVPWVDPSVDQPEVETWTRTETRRVGGRTVSIFNPSWSGARIAKFFWSNRWGWDDGGIYWGEFLPGDVQPGSGWGITLRIASRALPRVSVTRLGDDVQYSSHVVNLVMPTFGDGFAGDDRGFELEQVAQRFYRDFEDTYDTLAIVPEAGYTASYEAYHRNVRQEVRGIGASLFDNSANYGSARRLQSVELFVNTTFTAADTTSHELVHQWGSYFDWTRLAAIGPHAAASAHDPLWTQGETIIGAVLQPWRRVEPAADGWQIGLTPAPSKLHPYTLYAMGLLPKESVPTVDVFENQAQFSPTWVWTPAVGTTVTGASRSVTVFNVIGMHGERSGPVPSVWQRATIVVSRDRLLSQREMDYWTFFAARAEDPAGTGVVSYDGVGSFESATSGLVDVQSDIRPLRAPPIVEPFAVDGRPFDRDDVRTIQFDQGLPSRFDVGRSIAFSGTVKAADRSDVSDILIRLWKYGGTTSDAIRIDGRVTGSSTFRMERQFNASQRGVYLMQVYLFWPGSGPQYSRASLSPIIIE
jgi:hypothetical protein